jgi:hypothetical protein
VALARGPASASAADAIAVAPATFNTVNKWAAGICLPFAGTSPRAAAPVPDPQSTASLEQHLVHDLDEPLHATLQRLVSALVQPLAEARCGGFEAAGQTLAAAEEGGSCVGVAFFDNGVRGVDRVHEGILDAVRVQRTVVCFERRKAKASGVVSMVSVRPGGDRHWIRQTPTRADICPQGRCSQGTWELSAESGSTCDERAAAVLGQDCDVAPAAVLDLSQTDGRGGVERTDGGLDALGKRVEFCRVFGQD